MNRFDILKPHFNHILTTYPNLQKDDLINLVRMNIIEWKDKSSLELLDEIIQLSESIFEMIMSKIGVNFKTTIIYSLPIKLEEQLKPETDWKCIICFTINNNCELCEKSRILIEGENSSITSSLGLSSGGSSSLFGNDLNDISSNLVGGGGSSSLFLNDLSSSLVPTITIRTNNWDCKICTFNNDKSFSECQMCFTPNDSMPNITSSVIKKSIPEENTSDWEIHSNKKKSLSIIEACAGGGDGGGADNSDNFSITGSSVTGTGSSITGMVNSKFDHIPISQKLYVKGWSEVNAPFPNGTENLLKDHINNAICRARESGLIEYVIGIEPLPKPTSVIIILTNNAIATAAMQLDNNIFWNNNYLQIKRPQGFRDSNDSSIAPLSMKIIRETLGGKLAPIISFQERNEIERLKLIKKHESLRKASALEVNKLVTSSAAATASAGGGGRAGGGNAPTAPTPKKKIIVEKPQPKLTAEQQKLVDSLKSKLRKPAFECLNILCAHDGRETSVYSEALYELCTVLQDHGLLTATKKGHKLVIKDNIVGSKSFCIDMNNHAQGHVMLHSIADVRNVLRNANFPEFAFT